MSTDHFIVHAIPPCTDIHAAARQMAEVARFTGKPVLAEFNSRVLLAMPGDEAADVIREWDQDQQRSYFGEVKF